MNTFLKKISLLIFLTGILSTCTDDEQIYIASAPAEGSFLINSSVTDIVLNDEDADSNIAVTLNWDNNSWYGIDTPISYTIQMDNVDSDFESPEEISVNGNNISMTHSELNSKAMALNLDPDIASEVEVRLKAALNYDALPIYSNVVTLTVTPYNTLSLLYDMPAELYLQGDAVPSNWGTPVPDSQKMVQIDDHRFGLLTELVGNKSFAAISAPATWSDPAYVAIDDQQGSSEGEFRPAGSQTVPQWGGNPISSPSTTGIYKVIFDFTIGRYSVTSAPSLLTPPQDLYIIGDATPLGWAANVDDTQKFTKLNDYTFEITIPLTQGGALAFITATSYSDPAYKTNTASQDAEGGDIIASGSATNPAWGGNDIIAPTSDNYTITVNFKSGTYILRR